MDGINNFESVFDNATELEREFDLMFEAEDDDDILSVVQGLNEDGIEKMPDYETLHQTDDATSVKDMEEELGPDHDTKNEPTADSNGEFDIEQDELDLACPKTGVADAVTQKAPDEENLTDAADKAADQMEKTYDESYNALMEEFGLDVEDEGLSKDSDQQDQLENNDDHDPDPTEPVKDEAAEGEAEPSIASDEEGDLTDEIEEEITDDDIPDEVKDEAAKGEKDPEDNGEEDGAVPDEVKDEAAAKPEENTDDSASEGEENVEESGDLTDEIEEEIIDDIESETDSTASESEVNALEDIDDDDILDDILAED